MKQFLRYQISGSVFIFWLIVFYFGKDTSNTEELIKIIYAKIDGVKSLQGLMSALPIGVIIHQVSVLIKNWVVGKCWKEFDDYPKKNRINNQSDDRRYILDKISNLNSFYYVRVDNGILAPLFAYIVVNNMMYISINSVWTSSAIIIGLILALYLTRIRKEIKEYNQMLKANSKLNIKETETYSVTVSKN